MDKLLVGSSLSSSGKKNKRKSTGGSDMMSEEQKSNYTDEVLDKSIDERNNENQIQIEV